MRGARAKPSYSPEGQASPVLAGRTLGELARLAAKRTRAPVTLDTSAPAVSDRHGELTVSVGFDPDCRLFRATRAQAAQTDEVFAGPSLTLACSAANQALEDLAPLPTLIRGYGVARYRRTRPQYQQEVHFARALARLIDLAGV